MEICLDAFFQKQSHVFESWLKQLHTECPVLKSVLAEDMEYVRRSVGPKAAPDGPRELVVEQPSAELLL